MKLHKSIISGFMAIAIAISFSVPSFALAPDTVIGAMEVAPDFGSWLWDTAKTAGNLFAGFLDFDNYCPGAETSLNGRHNFVPQHTTVNGKTGMFYICENCGKSAGEVLEPVYNDYVANLPSQGYNSAGRLIWQPSVDDVDSIWFYGFRSIYNIFDDFPSSWGEELEDGSGYFLHYDFSSPSTSSNGFGLRISFRVPISGQYRRLTSTRARGYVAYSNGSYSTLYTDYVESSSFAHRNSGSIGWSNNSDDRLFTNEFVSTTFNSFSFNWYFPFYEVIPDIEPSGDLYSITTRPTSITGGNYGIVGDNGQITKVENNSTIVNETNNTYYNPATGQTGTITNWSYDYSDRSYHLTLQTGDTITVTYGDEYITIQEGDTIYNIYYIIESSGSNTHTHDWRESSVTSPTCTQTGRKVYTCSTCGDTKQETISALGHDWLIKETQQGYTIYECSRCHEQYKSENGTVPPGGGSGTDPGGEDNSIWTKLGELLGSILGGILALIESIISAILDALISLAKVVLDKLAAVVEVVLKLFEEIPKLFGGFLAFLTAVFPYLPPELMTILTFGLAAVVFIGILKAVRR